MDVDETPTCRPRAEALDRAVRRAILISSRRLAERAGEADAVDLGALDRWFAGFAAEVRSHVELVETDLLPRLVARGVLDDRDLDGIAADHAWLDQLLSEVGDGLGVLAFNLGEPGYWTERVRSLCAELDLVVVGVLGRERRRLDPLVDRALTPDERREHADACRRSLAAAAFGVAWLHETLGDVPGLVLPGPLSLYHRTRRRAYRRAAAALERVP